MINVVKKFLRHIGIPVVAVAVVILCFIIVMKGGKNTVSQTDCPKLSKSQLSSERSLGLVVENRRLLGVLLSGEKNYSPPGGHVEVGETYPQALVREFQEEIGLKVDPSALSQYKITCEPRYGSIERTYYYLVKDWSGSIALTELGDKVKWVNYNYHSNKNADTEFKTALLFLKEGNLID